MKLTIALMVAATSFASAQTPISGSKFPGADNRVRHVIGLDEKTKRNAMGSLTVHDGVLEFTSGNAGQEVVSKVPVASVEDVFIGTESTETRGKSAKAVKTAGYAAPYGTGRSLSLLLREKVDVLTVSFHDSDGSLHGAIFALPTGQAETVRTALVQAGVHASPIEP